MSLAADFLNRSSLLEKPQKLVIIRPNFVQLTGETEANSSNKNRETTTFSEGQPIHASSDAPCERQSKGPIKLLLPGSFNPLHAGHREMARFSSDLLSTVCWFELTLTNADKGRITQSQLACRLEQDFSPFGLVLSTATRFIEKCSLYPAATFVLGADTILRLADPKYYDDDREKMMSAFKTIESNGNRFLVFGRRFDGRFNDSTNLKLPPELIRVCQFVDEAEFNMDLSSSKIRKS